MTNVYDNAGHLERLGAFGDGPDAPYPGMIEAFETHYGQSFRDKDWRPEAACWAAAWRKAVLVANPQAEPVRLTDEQVAKVDTAICEALGEAYDYLRGGIAWSCETMGPEDFSLVADDSDRVASIREAVLQALGLVEGAEPLKAKPVSLTDAAMLDLWFGDIEPVGLLSERVVRFGFKVQQALLAANGLLEGAEPLKAEPVPVEAIGRILTEVMGTAVENGASSVSMPDDYVAVAAWLCRVEGAEEGI